MSGLAYIGRVEGLSPIENADRIESAQVVCGEGGKWTGVVKRGDFQPGDRCTVYLQDAVVPQSDDLAFLKSTNWRVKMARFRGAPSECVIVPCKTDGDIGRDLTTELGVTKYEKSLPPLMAGNAYGAFPSFIPRTDEPNFQSARKLVEALRGQPWYATVKCDGSSATAFRHEGRFGVCSRNLELQESPQTLYWSVALKYSLKEKLPEGIALQWETCGPGVQKNPLGLKAVDGFAFQAWNITERRYLHRVEFLDLCESIQFPTVPHVHSTDNFEFQYTDDWLRKFAEGEYPNGKQREGVVIRPYQEQWVGHERLSFKVINLLYKES